jgi:ATP/maltotriose-dependent transcriptional regulator MalT
MSTGPRPTRGPLSKSSWSNSQCAEAEAPAREATEVFQAAQAREIRVRAWVVLGRTLVGQGNPDLAQSEIEPATRLAAKGADIAPVFRPSPLPPVSRRCKGMQRPPSGS